MSQLNVLIFFFSSQTRKQDNLYMFLYSISNSLRIISGATEEEVIRVNRGRERKIVKDRARNGDQE